MGAIQWSGVGCRKAIERYADWNTSTSWSTEGISPSVLT
ncbi:MAG: hypothetical protein ACI9EZ_001663, partial [Halobacteriales archaeon]